MLHCFAKRAIVVTGLLLTPIFGEPQQNPADKNKDGAGDHRSDHLKGFLKAKGSPLAEYATAFLEAADRHSLDWRLLPTLALVESAGGRVIRNNNVFGWGNGRIRFASIPESIHIIAERLANSNSYRNKSTEDKLRAYNPRNRKYASHVLEMMSLVGPAGAPAAAITATMDAAATLPANESQALTASPVKR